MEYFITPLKQYADFSGKATRKEYWMFILLSTLINIGLMVIDVVLNTAFLSAIFSIALLIPSISCATRRLHDIGKSGWWQLLYFIPLIGVIVVIVFLCQRSNEESEYGNIAEA